MTGWQTEQTLSYAITVYSNLVSPVKDKTELEKVLLGKRYDENLKIRNSSRAELLIRLPYKTAGLATWLPEQFQNRVHCYTVVF